MLATHERGLTASTEPGVKEPPNWRGAMAGPAVAIVTVLTALIATDSVGLPLRDPDNVGARRFAMAACLVLALVGLDIVIRACRRSRSLWPSPAALRSVRRERWTPARGLAVGTAVVSFYLTYLAYRNVKSVVPLLRPGELFDRELAEFDRSLLGGSTPASLLHDLLGTGISTHLLSFVYMLFLLFVPVSLAVALVFSPNLQGGLFYATALSINWALGAASYFLLPALGPVYFEPAAFAHLPASEVTRLQDILLDQRVEFLSAPVTGTAQSIGAFASLHVSIVFTAVVATHLLALARPVKVAAWLMLALTAAATIYFGWHYILDDIAGLAIGAIALVLARALTGFDVRTARRPLPARNLRPA